jgi:hypothetical protein
MALNSMNAMRGIEPGCNALGNPFGVAVVINIVQETATCIQGALRDPGLC